MTLVPSSSGERIDEVEVVELLALLTDRSLVVPVDSASGARYRLLETVRQYGQDLLAQDDQAGTLYGRHARYYGDLAEACEPKLKGWEQMATLALLEREYENLRAALDRGTSGEGSEEALRLAANLAIFWWRQGHLAEGAEWCHRAAATPIGQQRSVLRARVLSAAGLLTAFQGDCAAARTLFEESFQILTELGDRNHLAEALCGVGFACFFLDDYAAAERHTKDAYNAALASNDEWYLAWAGYFLGIIARVNGDYDAAIRSYSEALALYRKLGDRIGSSYPMYDIGLAEYYRGNLEAGERYLAESLAIRQETSDMWGMSESLFGLGLVAAGRKELAIATERLLESRRIATEIGDKTRVAICAYWLGTVALGEGDTNAALRLNEESLTIYTAVEDRWGLAYCIAGYAALAATKGDWERAVRLWSFSEKLRDDIGSPLPPIERAQRGEQLATAKMDLPSFDKAWEEGRQLDLQQALELGRSDGKS